MKCFKRNKRDYQPAAEKQPAEKLAEIGALLRLKRQEKALSLEEVVVKTRIQRRFLQALEEGKLNELPEPIYIQSFIKQYAEALGLNGAELSNTFPTTSYSRLKINRSGRSLPRVGLLPIHLYLLYIFMVFCIVNGLSLMLNRFEVRTNTQPTQEKPMKEGLGARG